MKRFTVVAAVLVSMLFTSCRQEIVGEFCAPGFVSDYRSFSSDNLPVDIGDECVTDGLLTIRLPLRYGKSSVYDTRDYRIEGEESRYYACCVKFNDLYYNQVVSITMDMTYMDNCVHAISEIVTDIEVLCDEDWAPGYPAGTSLNDIFSIRLVSLYPYVSCGYTGDVDTRIDKPLSDVTSEDMTLVRYNHIEDRVFDLYTSVLPDESVRTLRVRLSTDEGRELEYAFNLGAGE